MHVLYEELQSVTRRLGCGKYSFDFCCLLYLCLPASNLVYTLVNGRTPAENQQDNFLYRGTSVNATHMVVEGYRLDYETTPWYSLRLRASVRYPRAWF